MIVSGFIVTLYSAMGGIRSVTFTDVIQFFTFEKKITFLSDVTQTYFCVT